MWFLSGNNNCLFFLCVITLVPLELWYIAASVALVLIVGGLWMYSNTGRIQIEKYIEFTAQESRMYLLPDSSKVWMQPGSSYVLPKTLKNAGMYG